MTVRRFIRQAEKCAALAKQTHDEESRQRYMQLQQKYLQLAESEDQPAVPMSVLAAASETKRADRP